LAGRKTDEGSGEERRVLSERSVDADEYRAEMAGAIWRLGGAACAPVKGEVVVGCVGVRGGGVRDEEDAVEPMEEDDD
jgi:hypothetical protein